MIITTTSVVDGFRIVKYFDPVVSNIVTGTGFLTDLVAGFSDVFGGRSDTYQQHLREMYAEATRDLEAKARAVGANCLVGASFDLDQISGKGMQMFMLNAVATPVTVKTDEEIAHEVEVARRSTDDAERRAAERRQRFEGNDVVQGLLADAEIAQQARKIKRMYGPDVCASFLQRKAHELGLGAVVVSGDGIPDEF